MGGVGLLLGSSLGLESYQEFGNFVCFSRSIKSSLIITSSSRVDSHLDHLLDMINKFPVVNPSSE